MQKRSSNMILTCINKGEWSFEAGVVFSLVREENDDNDMMSWYDEAGQLVHGVTAEPPQGRGLQ